MNWTQEPDGWYATGHLGHQFLIQPWGESRYRFWVNGWTPKFVPAIGSLQECKNRAEEEDAQLEPDKRYKEQRRLHDAHRKLKGQE